MTALHPGSACCDLSQDLAGWIAAERARIAVNYRWARVLSRRGQRLRRLSVSARADRGLSYTLAREGLACAGRAMAVYQAAQLAEGHVDRVEAGHWWRLEPSEPSLFDGLAVAS